MLLALSRGAGLPGLAAMPPRFERHGMRFERPLLGIGGAAISRLAGGAGRRLRRRPDQRRHRLHAQPHPPRTAAGAGEGLPAVPRDLRALGAPCGAGPGTAGGAGGGGPGRRSATRRRSASCASSPGARQANVLRHWLRTAHQARPSAAQMEELLDQVEACATRGHDIRIKVGTGFVRARRAMPAIFGSLSAGSARSQSAGVVIIRAFARRGPRRAVSAIAASSSHSLPMALIVHKYGGTSMGSTERIRNVAKRVAKWASRRPPDGRGAQRHERRNQPPAGPGQGTGARPSRPTRYTASSTCWPPPASRPRRRCWRSRCRPKAWKPSATPAGRCRSTPTAPTPRPASNRSTTRRCAPTWPPARW